MNNQEIIDLFRIDRLDIEEHLEKATETLEDMVEESEDYPKTLHVWLLEYVKAHIACCRDCNCQEEALIAIWEYPEG
jgi:hypothetical protein